MVRHSWTLLLHDGVTLQLRKLQEAAAQTEQNDPQGFESNPNDYSGSKRAGVGICQAGFLSS
ncbi:hypothetical protein PSEG_03186 [Pseudomonas sp. Nvir]|jgi:hypothetical protein|nr:hypothetical protein PSNVIR_05230 [Pseudomonas sp. Nvir]SUD78842.1 toxin-antitoxin system toxin component [Pseudomonas putida]